MVNLLPKQNHHHSGLLHTFIVWYWTKPVLPQDKSSKITSRKRFGVLHKFLKKNYCHYFLWSVYVYGYPKFNETLQKHFFFFWVTVKKSVQCSSQDFRSQLPWPSTYSLESVTSSKLPSWICSEGRTETMVSWFLAWCFITIPNQLFEKTYL